MQMKKWSRGAAISALMPAQPVTQVQALRWLETLDDGDGRQREECNLVSCQDSVMDP